MATERQRSEEGFRDNVSDDGSSDGDDIVYPTPELRNVFDYMRRLQDVDDSSGNFERKFDFLNSTEYSYLVEYSYRELLKGTSNFSDGMLLGEGGYGKVYLAQISGCSAAVKKFKDSGSECYKQFETEIKNLSRCRHQNILPLLGFSEEGLCLVYKCMVNGSLADKLFSPSTTPLPSSTRKQIALGVAYGLKHMHEYKLVHRDIKCDNILLDSNFEPKIGDFGLIRLGSNGTRSVVITDNVLGTYFYMAPEAYAGEVSIKQDTYSFGLVLLELLTSSRAWNYICTNWRDFQKLVDKNAAWDNNDAKALLKIARKCVTRDKAKRPQISQILPDLERCCGVQQEPLQSVTELLEMMGTMP